MIHIIHTPAATLARRRMQLLLRCALGVAAAGSGVAGLGACSTILQPATSGCNFTGVPFYPAVCRQSPPQKVLSFPAPSLPTPDLPVLPVAMPQASMACEEIGLLCEEQPEADILLETDAEALLRVAPQKRPTRKLVAAADTTESYTPPVCRNCPEPPYPAYLRHLRFQGQLAVLISVSAEGRPTEVEIASSSGNKRLDSHTRRWILQHWLFRPAHKGTIPVAAQVRTNIIYVWAT